MNRRNLIPVAILAALTIPGVASAHNATATGTCTAGVAWAATNYDKTVVNTITVTIDGTVRHQDLDFKASDSGQVATDQTKNHTWTVDIDAPGGQYDRHLTGSYTACVVATTTTTVTPTTTTVAPTTTTVSAVPCQEDEPCWDCSTMGNQICGPTVEVVTPTVPTATLPPVVTSVPANVTLPATGDTSDSIVTLAFFVASLGIALALIARRRGVA